MPITEHQQQLLSRLGANYTNGLTTSEASNRRNSKIGGLNKVQKPINCPSWVCCLLPCINHIPSMKQFKYVQPDDAEVLRDGRWIRYDAASLVVGDIVRLAEGDVVPADCVVISLGMEHVDATTIVGDDEEDVGNTSTSSATNVESLTELTVDSHYITGETKPRHLPAKSNQTVQSALLYYGSRVLEGACIAVVTGCGEGTILAKLIKEGRWPPKQDLSDEVEEIGRMNMDESSVNDDYDSSGISLVNRYS